MDSTTGANEIVIRAKEATIGIPSETRQAHKDGTNGFERILPGPERMYPDTDLPPKRITKERLDNIRAGLPEYYWEREAFYHSLNLPSDVIKSLAVSKYARLFNDLVKNLEIDPKLASIVLVQYMKKLRRRRVFNEVQPEVLMEIFKAFKAGKLLKDAIFEVLEAAAKSGEFNEDMLPKIAGKDEFVKVYNRMQERINRINFYHPEKKEEYLFGMIMDELRGRMNGSDAKNYLNELIKMEA